MFLVSPAGLSLKSLARLTSLPCSCVHMQRFACVITPIYWLSNSWWAPTYLGKCPYIWALNHSTIQYCNCAKSLHWHSNLMAAAGKRTWIREHCYNLHVYWFLILYRWSCMFATNHLLHLQKCQLFSCIHTQYTCTHARGVHVYNLVVSWFHGNPSLLPEMG